MSSKGSTSHCDEADRSGCRNEASGKGSAGRENETERVSFFFFLGDLWGVCGELGAMTVAVLYCIIWGGALAKLFFQVGESAKTRGELSLIGRVIAGDGYRASQYFSYSGIVKDFKGLNQYQHLGRYPEVFLCTLHFSEVSLRIPASATP